MNTKWISEKQLFSDYGYKKAIAAITNTLESGFDPANDKPRSFVEFSNGQGLIMPSEIGDFVGLKFVTVAPDNPKLDLPRIQGNYTLFDSKTLTPLAQCDGAALTLLRTASVTAAVVQKLQPIDNPHLVIFGSGPQALAHILAIKAISNPASIKIIARNQLTASELIAGLSAMGINAGMGSTEDLKQADLVITATTAREPLFGAENIKTGAIVAAVGSHEPNARELPAEFLAQSDVYIEDHAAAMREAGDVLLAMADSKLNEEDLIPLATLFVSHQINPNKTRVYKSTGMPWQDLAIFADAYKYLSA